MPKPTGKKVAPKSTKTKGPPPIPVKPPTPVLLGDVLKRIEPLPMTPLYGLYERKGVKGQWKQIGADKKGFPLHVAKVVYSGWLREVEEKGLKVERKLFPIK